MSQTNGSCGIQNGGQKAGSSHTVEYTINRNEISNANTMFSRVTNTIERRPTPNTSYVWVKSNMAVQKPEVEINLLISLHNACDRLIN
jgi:hypothetical protein